MGLPALYYSGRENPPHPEIWINYFLKMVLLYSNKVCDLQNSSSEADVEGSLSYLKGKLNDDNCDLYIKTEGFSIHGYAIKRDTDAIFIFYGFNPLITGNKQEV